MAQKPSIPKGTRDFGQQETAERNYIFDTIKSVFKTFGYAQIETPAMENLSTLLGKYGDEGDKLLFRILNSGEAIDLKQLKYTANHLVSPLQIRFLPLKVKEELLSNGTIDCIKGKFILKVPKEEFVYRIRGIVRSEVYAPISEKGLRYDLTVPFARYVVQHQNEISFPFKRFQIQPVWRADRPQKGRYREFYQCDVDVIGSRSQLNELELVQIVDRVFNLLDVNVLIKINNRKVLTGFAEICGFPDKVVDITVAIDKLDKIGLEAVEAEMMENGLTKEAVAVIEPILQLSGSAAEKIAAMRTLMNGGSASGLVSETGLKGLDELEELFGYIEAAGVRSAVEIDLSLARGLNYYTGAIFEVKALDWQIGSICGGGRYDNLTGIFGLPDMSGVGISFGADRIYDVLKGLGRFPEGLKSATRVLFANMGREETQYVLDVAGALRGAGVAVEVYPDSAKLKKQFDYADRKAIPFLSINGETELAAGMVLIKNLATGEQRSFDRGDIAGMLAFLS